MTDLAALDEWVGDYPTLLHRTRWTFDIEAIAYRLKVDPQFAIEMRLCKEWQIPHSQFLSWDEEDQAKALGYFYHEAQRCAACGIHPDDWPDPAEPLFEAVAETCPGCAELDRYKRWQEEQMENAPKSAMDGVRSHLRRVADG